MDMLCVCYASAMRLLCACYAHAIREACDRYASAMRPLCVRYATAMRLLCRYIQAEDIEQFMSSYRGRKPYSRPSDSV